MNYKQLALMKKDIRSITSNKQVIIVMLSVPLALSIIMPSIFVLVTAFVPAAASDFQKLLDMLSVTVPGYSKKQMMIELVLNKIMPVFFLMIPIMSSSVMAASSFVGEKEKHTLETLLYSPLSIKQLFRSKILAGFCVGMLVSFVSFAAMLLVLEVEAVLVTGAVIWPSISWLIVMLVIAPAISLIAIAITVRGSAKAQTMEEAQQRAAFMIFPVLALVIGQFTGVILVSTWLLVGLGLILVLLAAVLMKGIAGRYTYEKLLK